MTQEEQDRAFAQQLMADAFAEWERRYREEPDRFMSDFQRYTQLTPETYGDQCAAFFAGLLDENDEKRFSASPESTGA
jgi:hypothetical protein